MDDRTQGAPDTCASRLTGDELPGRSRVMFDLDEERARPTALGTIAHAAIAKLAAHTRSPSLAQVQALVDEALSEFAAIEARAHRQNIRGVVHRYFSRCLPPARFIFGGAHYDLGVGRPDLIWFDVDGCVLADEVKTGSPQSLLLATTTEQVERYRAACCEVWGDRFVGIRLLCPADPAASLFIHPSGLRTPLSATPHLHHGT